MNEKPMRLHAFVYGRVQGVNFRFYTTQEAHARALTGWVANRFDGSVEVVAEGQRPALQSFLQFLHRGPRSARVDRVQADWTTATDEFNSFRVRF